MMLPRNSTKLHETKNSLHKVFALHGKSHETTRSLTRRSHVKSPSCSFVRMMVKAAENGHKNF